MQSNRQLQALLRHDMLSCAACKQHWPCGTHDQPDQEDSCCSQQRHSDYQELQPKS